jgi:CheY-like chemotaxis protein
MLQRLLTQRGFSVDVAEEATLPVVRSSTFTMTRLCDLQMPNMDGIELFE